MSAPRRRQAAAPRGESSRPAEPDLLESRTASSPPAPRKRPASSRPAAPHAVRIIGGQWKRSKLPVPDAPGLRPTPDRIRETLFNWLGQDLTGWRCLDAFAGSGALGFEAASRGAASAVLLERDRRLVRSLTDSQRRLGATALRVENADAMHWLASCEPGEFDLIFIDPPFDSGLAEPALERCARILSRHGVVYFESAAPIDAERLAGAGWRIARVGRAGRVHFALLRRV